MMNSLQQMAEQCEKEGIAFWEMVLRNDMSDRLVSREAVSAADAADVPDDVEADASYDPKLHSASGYGWRRRREDPPGQRAGRACQRRLDRPGDGEGC